MSIGDTLRKIMKEKGVTPYRIQKDTGIYEGTIRGWFKGKMPRVDHLHKVCQYLEINPAILFNALQDTGRVAEEVVPYGNAITEKINRLLPALDEEKKRKVLRFTEDQKLLSEFQRHKKKAW